jgi:hypothetical protein
MIAPTLGMRGLQGLQASAQRIASSMNLRFSWFTDARVSFTVVDPLIVKVGGTKLSERNIPGQYQSSSAS